MGLADLMYLWCALPVRGRAGVRRTGNGICALPRHSDQCGLAHEVGLSRHTKEVFTLRRFAWTPAAVHLTNAIGPSAGGWNDVLEGLRILAFVNAAQTTVPDRNHRHGGWAVKGMAVSRSRAGLRPAC